jgi:hypothetical protein
VAAAIDGQSKLSQPERAINSSCARQSVYLSPEAGSNESRLCPKNLVVSY